MLAQEFPHIVQVLLARQVFDRILARRITRVSNKREPKALNSKSMMEREIPGVVGLELGDVGVAEDAPEAVERGVMVEEGRGRGVFEEEAEVGEVGEEAGEEGREEFLVVWEVDVASTLVVV